MPNETPQKDENREKDQRPPDETTAAHFRQDLPALILVIIFGGIGATLACWWHLSIGDTDFASSVSKLHWFLRVCLGSVGATAAVFLLARTDTTRLIHCSLIAVLSGMAGPYLVTKALSTVVSVNPELVKIDAAISIVESTTTNLDKELQTQKTQETEANPQKIVDAFEQTAQTAVSYLSALKEAPKQDKKQALSGNKEKLQATLKSLNTAAGLVPKQSLPLIQKIASEATDAGAPEIAEQAKQIIETNSAVQSAVKAATKSGKVYFITPEELTDIMLHDLQKRIKDRFSLADFQPTVHPSRRMDAGLEIVYYRNNESDRKIAEDLSKVLVDYFKGDKVAPKNAIVTKGSSDQTPMPFQFDIHIGPDVASNLIAKKIAAAH